MRLLVDWNGGQFLDGAPHVFACRLCPQPSIVVEFWSAMAHPLAHVTQLLPVAPYRPALMIMSVYSPWSSLSIQHELRR
jgi:hypothetical protein